MNQPNEEILHDFVRAIVREDLDAGRLNKGVVTRFPPEPNGYLHIGHAKSIVLNFGIARDFNGRCHLRFDDTNPIKEEQEYIDSIKELVRWLGYDWGEDLYYTSDYFDQLYDWAEILIKNGKAFVDDQNAEQIRNNRGSLTKPGQNSPHRERSVEENLELFRKMRAGDFADGERVLRAKIDMASPNLNLRDPIMYRILHAEHPRSGDKWCIYPMYDWAHGQSDAIENITHSVCTLEFENHRPLYDWFLDQLPVDPDQRPHQHEFARLNLEFTVMSKRKLLQLVEDKQVDGWDDPRLPTLAGLRRRGYTPESIRAFCERVGVAKKESRIDIAFLEKAIRDDLNTKTKRSMCVLDPIKVVIENYPEDKEDTIEAPFFPDDPPRMGTRQVPFGREIYIERQDFMEDPPKKFFRLAPGREVRLRWGYFITCTEVIKDDQGQVTELRCTYDPETRGGNAPDGRRVKGTIHWVAAKYAKRVKVRLYDRLFSVANPEASKKVDYREHLNPESLVEIEAMAEPSLAEMKAGERVQFERTGYFYVDAKDSKEAAPVFHRIVTLRDGWAKIAKQGRKQGGQKAAKK